MRHYEMVFIVHPDQSEQVPAMIDRYRTMVGSRNGSVHRLEDWGRRQLAYPIRKQTAGRYVVVQFNAAAESLPEFERVLKLDDELLRYLVVLHEGEPAAPMSIATREPKPEGEDDDEEE